MTSRSRAGLLGAALFVGAQVVSLLANYGFQLLAARKLAPEAYVGLFGWLAELAAYGVLSIVALNVALTRPPPPARAGALRTGGLGLALVAAAFALARTSGMPLAFVVAIAIAFGYASGAALARDALVLSALASTAVFVVRIGWFVVAPRADVGERSTLLGYAAGLGVLVAAGAVGGSVDDESTSTDASVRSRASLLATLGDAARAALLSGAQAVAPVADYLLLRGSVPSSMQAAWASGSLLFRVPVVLGMGVLQVALTKRLATSRTGQALPPWVRFAEIAMPASLFVLAVLPLDAVFARVLALVVGGAPSDYAELPFGRMCWSAGATVATLAVLQIAHVARDVRGAAAAVGAGALVAVGVATTGAAWTSKLAILATLWTSLAGVLLWRSSHDHLPSRASRLGARPDAERGQDARPRARGGAKADASGD